jgi:hypothetical protein
MPSKELNALKQLKNQHEIKPVDKGLGIAVINRASYIALAHRDHLSDTNTYHKLSYNPTNEISTRISSSIDILLRNNMLTKAAARQMRPTQLSHLGKFYILPKLHKTKLSTRPIVSNVGHLTQGVSKYIHQHMLHTAKQAASYLENSLELSKLLKMIKPTNNTFIITADITSLYTNIPNEDGIKTVAKQTATDSHSPYHMRSIYKNEAMLRLVLENNAFTFNDEYFIQTNGTAMGTIMAPTYANIYLRAKEETSFQNNPFKANVLLYKRYIDDILAVYNNHDNTLQEYIQLLHKTYSPLKLTLKIGKQKIPFLDLELSINQELNIIDHDIYQKPLSLKAYIPHNSLHPQHINKSIIYNDLLRTNLLTTRPQVIRQKEMIIMARALANGHKRKEVKRLTQRARSKVTQPTDTIIQDQSQIKQHKMLVKLTHNGRTTEKLIHALKQQWAKSAAPNTRVVICTKTNKNIQKLVVNSTVGKTTSQSS